MLSKKDGRDDEDMDDEEDDKESASAVSSPATEKANECELLFLVLESTLLLVKNCQFSFKHWTPVGLFHFIVWGYGKYLYLSHMDFFVSPHPLILVPIPV